ncbi:MAG TPA: glutathione S-transferase family protein [Burkholderiales bacterium]|nr:glutathione S-transferase family protein [Burkholderiales bacterium]
MLRLHGFPVSNYYNRVKLVLLEKAIPFEEVLARPGTDPSVKESSPARKVPFLELEDGQYLAESSVIAEYLEEIYPQKPLLPQDPLARARVRELSLMIDLHLELVARRLYMEAFFGGGVSDETKKEVERELRRGVGAFERLVKFDPYIAGREFTLADCTAAVHLPVISICTKLIYGKDVLEAYADRIKPYMKMLGERPAVAKVNADRKAYQATAS